MSAAQAGYVLRAAYVGDGYFQVRFQPFDPSSSLNFTYQVAVLVETSTPAGDRFMPDSYKAFLGSSLTPYTDYGLSFNPIWGGVKGGVGGT
eukprot:6314725-Prymnesium_polylepis.1